MANFAKPTSFLFREANSWGLLKKHSDNFHSISNCYKRIFSCCFSGGGVTEKKCVIDLPLVF